jgi:branched-chain amino acid transport system substrate-binding protein
MEKTILAAARDSNAEVLGLANGHAELLKAMGAMETMNLTGRIKLVGLLTFIDDIHEMGLEEAQDLYLADSWFWTRDAESRQWAERFFSRQNRMPSSLQYLKAVEAVGTTDPDAVIARLRSGTLNDMYVKNGRIRKDGTMLHDMYLLRVKRPGESQRDWDFYDLVATVSGEEAFPE